MAKKRRAQTSTGSKVSPPTKKPTRAATRARADRQRADARSRSRTPKVKGRPKAPAKPRPKPTSKDRARRERKNAARRLTYAKKRAAAERAQRKADHARKLRNAERRAARASEKRAKEEARKKRRARSKVRLAEKLAAATRKKPRVPKPKPAPVPVASETQKPWTNRTAEDVPKRKVPKIVRQVHAAGEVLLDRLLKYRDQLAAKGWITPPDGHSFGERWATFSEHVGGRVGIHRSLKIMRPVLESTIEQIVYEVMVAAKEVHAALPNGKLYASLHLLEYGRRLAGSPGEMYFDDGAGFFVQSFEGVPGSTIYQFEIRLRRVLERIVCTDRSAVFLEHVIVRAYQERVGHAGRALRKPGPKRKPRRKK